jgi:SAM-dependent methyltransferase
MEENDIVRKFGDCYVADERTFKMGIHWRITARIAGRFRGRHVLETCSGGGFTTIALARAARRVTTIEIDGRNQEQAGRNVARAGLARKVDFILGDALNEELLRSLAGIDAAFLDPDWADGEPGHIYRFRGSNTRPPADRLLKAVFRVTPNIALVLPPRVPTAEFRDLPAFELQKIFLDNEHALNCLYFGELAQGHGETKMFVGG